MCEILCDCALGYYENNKNKFKDKNVSVITQEDVVGELEYSKQHKDEKWSDQWLLNILNEKLKRMGNTKRITRFDQL